MEGRLGKLKTILEIYYLQIAGKTEKEFVVHSTSWRYKRPDKVLLTSAAYFDELEFKRCKYG